MRNSCTPQSSCSCADPGPELTDAQWRERLTPEQYRVLRVAGTEFPGSSALNVEKRPGEYRCAGCDLPLFDADMKFDSGTGWPSFFATLPESVRTRTDTSSGQVRTEYHCARCGGHLGHLFEDGPLPSGQRYCTNGLALRFVSAV